MWRRLKRAHLDVDSACLVRAGMFLYDHLARREILPGSHGISLKELPPARGCNTPNTPTSWASSAACRRAAKVFNVTEATAKKWLKRDAMHDRSIVPTPSIQPRARPRKLIVLALPQSLYLPVDDPRKMQGKVS